MKRAPKEPWTSSGFHKTIFWWVKCKCIRNIWIKFPLKHVGVWKRGGKAGQTHFRVLANPKHLKSTLRCLNKSKPTALAHPGWDGSSTLAARQTPSFQTGRGGVFVQARKQHSATTQNQSRVCANPEQGPPSRLNIPVLVEAQGSSWLYFGESDYKAQFLVYDTVIKLIQIKWEPVGASPDSNEILS